MSRTSPRTTPARLRELAVSERAELDRLLDEVLIAHVGLSAGRGGPGHDGPGQEDTGREDTGRGNVVVIPTALARDGDSILIHGSTGSGWMRLAADGRPACVTVTALEGIIVARSAFESSFRYRSAVLFGAFSPVPDEAKEHALHIITERILPGRPGELRAPRPRELAATLVLRMPIGEWSLKVSAGWPDDPADDAAGDAWAGVIPLSRPRPGPPEPAPDLRPGIPVPRSVRDAARR
jgi:nitroimidazol reductase NimA-like FMN-containing flavoprotein (pyridoxamine 5'-phosphate oxidase superfamily)